MAHLLLVDDDNDVVEALGELLRAEGHEVHSASTGEEGLAVLRAASLPDVLVLDVDMPILGGPGMAHQMLLHDAGEEHVRTGRPSPDRPGGGNVVPPQETHDLRGLSCRARSSPSRATRTLARVRVRVPVGVFLARTSAGLVQVREVRIGGLPLSGERLVVIVALGLVIGCKSPSTMPAAAPAVGAPANLCRARARCSISRQPIVDVPGAALVTVRLAHAPDARTDEERCDRREYPRSNENVKAIAQFAPTIDQRIIPKDSTLERVLSRIRLCRG